ncbi:uncharacterized protein LOC128160076 [Crassostrea angulata]|uniref:uncharacterized protein LOC128160076 n=1 Tax=Magallana angulata TaxID=2784310 RepID=UPI0022B1EB73|nr:uncharacterized protein LOC128160076 [Crassostrea angulata]
MFVINMLTHKTGNIIAGSNREYSMMLSYISCICVITIIFTWATRINRAACNVTEHCGYNTYKDGNVCRDCPVGYFGFHCSNKCPPPSYGVHCSQVCKCSPCDHAFGCTLNTKSQETGSTTAVKHKSSPKLQIIKNITNQKTQDSISIVETTTYIPNGRMEVMTTQIPKKDITPVIIIFIGSFICLVLMFEIRREIKLYMEVISETTCA